MRNIFTFFVKYGSWFLFVIYFVASIVWMVTGNRYQQSVYLTSAGNVTSWIYETSGNVTGYFNLRSINEDLQRRNALLENEVLNLRNSIDYYKTLVPEDSAALANVPMQRFSYIMATVINNSTNQPQNYFTINRGSKDGIEKGMGVVNQNGVVGIVNVTGQNSSRVISLLNETQHFSVKVKGTNSVGSLRWHTGNPAIAYAEEMPRHIPYHVGDTIVTSGYSTTFPEGIPVGVIMGQVHGSDDNFFTLKLRLLPKFTDLSTVRVIKDSFKNEIDSLATMDAP
jgi:rod shape-determining protein MreC